MPWVSRHRRRVPGGWGRRTTVRSHYRRGSGLPTVIGIAVAVLVILLLIALF